MKWDPYLYLKIAERWRAGEVPTPEQYLEQFPNAEHKIERAFRRAWAERYHDASTGHIYQDEIDELSREALSVRADANRQLSTLSYTALAISAVAALVGVLL